MKNCVESLKTKNILNLFIPPNEEGGQKFKKEDFKLAD